MNPSSLQYQHLMKGLNKYIAAIIFLSFSAVLNAQTKQELSKEKTRLEKEILYTEGLLEKTKKNKQKSLSYLKVLESQINKKEMLLNTVSLEIKILRKQIKKTNASIIATEKSILEEEEKIEGLKREYSKMIYSAFKQKGSRNDLIYIVSSKDFNQAYKRILYLRQYSVFRKNQAKNITKSQERLIKKKEKLANQKDKLIEESAVRKELIDSKKDELKSITDKKSKKTILVKKLIKSEKKFKAKLKEKQEKAGRA